MLPALGIMKVMDYAWQSAQEEKQFRRQKELMAEQAGYASSMYDKTNTASQVGIMKAAGLNPGLMYGMSGGQPATTGPGGAPMPASKAVQGTMSELGMQNASIENMEADAELKRAQADEINRWKRDSTEAGTGETKQRTLNLETEGKQKQLDYDFSKETYDTRRETMEAEKDSRKYQSDIDYDSKNVSRATVNDRIDKVRAERINEQVKKSVMESGIKLNDAHMEKITQEIAQNWEQIAILRKNAETAATAQEIAQARLDWDKLMDDVTESWELGINTGAKIVGDIIGAVGMGKILGGAGKIPAKEWKKHIPGKSPVRDRNGRTHPKGWTDELK